MACDPLSISGRIVAFQARYILNGMFSGSVTIADPGCEFTIDCDLCQPIQVSLGSVTAGICPDCEEFAADDCFSSNPNWIAGLVTGISQEGVFQGVPTVTAEIVSFAEYLTNKPINTQKFDRHDLRDVLDNIAMVYSGIPIAWRDFSDIGFSEFQIKGPIEGNSTIAELQKLAAAGYSHLFTQVGGVLTIEHWKDHNSSVDYVIPPELIVTAKRSPRNPGRVSLVRVRGAATTKYNCGQQVFTDTRISDINGGYKSVGGYFRTCSFSGVPTPNLNLSFDNLAASEEDLKNATVLSDNAGTDGLYALGEGTFGTRVFRTDGQWFDDSGYDYALMVTGQRRPRYEYQDGDYATPHLRKGQANREKRHRRKWAHLSRWAVPEPTFESGSGWGDESGAFVADQTTMEQLEMEVIDPRFSSCGTRYEQIENPYIAHKESLFYLGVRRFMEMRMEENTWLLEVAYMPCLRLNQVIQFPASIQEGCNEQTVTGVIAGIDLTYSAEEPDVSMRLTVWGFDCLADLSYTSGNLLVFECAGHESGTNNPWIATALGVDSQATMEDDCGFIYTEGFPSIAELELNQTFMIPGDTYTVSFDYEALIGGFTPFTFDYPGGSVPLNGSGSFSIPFIAVSATDTFTWTLANSFIPTGYRICQVELTKTITL